MTPDQHTIQEFYLDVGDGHQLYVQDWGDKTAKTPIILLHGGPGGGCSDGQKQQFDPEQHRVIFFDQRGSGKSLPFGSLEHNTTPDMINDISKVADRCDVSSFIIRCGSWGSFLGLAYALEHPERVVALVLVGVHTGAQDEIDWLDKGKFKAFFPEVWEQYLAQVPETEHEDPTGYLHKQVASGDAAAIKKAAYAYETMQYSMISLDDRKKPIDYETYDPAGILTELHYYHPDNTLFIPANYILDNAHKITAPVWLIQGRYDVVCPPFAAHRLHKLLPNSHLTYTIAGHTGSDRANFDVARTILLQLAEDK